ncbi:MAG: PhzF family phenazine biosynthesis protein [Acidobacteria bacterium]|nr:PhzF family phenazine biosynthesis protein [Acidobacteriota bacterium]
MNLTMYQVDAFASRVFTGNPAAIVPLTEWLPDGLMQSIAMENNLAETAYLVKQGEDYGLKWFTPEREIDLCGHATLASASVVMEILEPGRRQVVFHTRSGPLTVTRAGEVYSMDFPARPPVVVQTAVGLVEALGGKPQAVMASRDYMVVYGTEAEVLALKPNMLALSELDRFGIIVTAPGAAEGVDFVSRFFAPAAGVPEDPVTGSAHCTLIPYWAERLGKTRLAARQVSARGGELDCELLGERVRMAGRTVLYLRGTITV